MCEKKVYQDYFEPKELLVLPVQRAAYSDRTAWLMAKLANLAYLLFEQAETQDRKTLQAHLATASFQLCATFNGEKTNTQAYLAKNSEFAVLVFRGTEENEADIKTDLNIRFYRSKHGRLHRGFVEAYQEVSCKIQMAVDQLGNMPLYITGHSLGGALACIATGVLANDNIAACYTFGSPRVGNDELDAHTKIPVYRVVNATDPITRMPFNIMGYTHVGDLRYLTADSRLLRNITFVRWLMIVIKSLINNIASFSHDHQIENYINKLEHIAKQHNTYLLTL